MANVRKHHCESRSGSASRHRKRGFWGELTRLRCPNCLSQEPPHKIRNIIPNRFLPLRLLFGCVRCNACLVTYYRLRLLNWLLRA
jgi:hypothetical protein